MKIKNKKKVGSGRFYGSGEDANLFFSFPWPKSYMRVTSLGWGVKVGDSIRNRVG